MRIIVNPSASRDRYSEPEALVICRSSAEDAYREIRQWPEYSQTPLHRLGKVAAALGIGDLYYKDESNRLGQGSFKTLGGAYAAILKLRTLPTGRAATFCCATDGNHGRSVAFAARRCGCGCVVFMHEHASSAKEREIARLGARVTRVAGTYDDSVRHAREMAARNDWLLISDTSDDPLDATTRHVIQGYGVMMLEVIRQLELYPKPTHVFVQGGVGGLAAAVAGLLAQVYAADRPRLIVVEPDAAACLLESALRGSASKIAGDLRTAMEMLSAGEASPVAWPVVGRRADVFITIPDSVAIETARGLLGGKHGELQLDVGVSGAAGLAGLTDLLEHREAAAMLGVGRESRVLVFGTEGSAR